MLKYAKICCANSLEKRAFLFYAFCISVPDNVEEDFQKFDKNDVWHFEILLILTFGLICVTPSSPPPPDDTGILQLNRV